MLKPKSQASMHVCVRELLPHPPQKRRHMSTYGFPIFLYCWFWYTIGFKHVDYMIRIWNIFSESFLNQKKSDFQPYGTVADFLFRYAGACMHSPQPPTYEHSTKFYPFLLQLRHHIWLIYFENADCFLFVKSLRNVCLVIVHVIITCEDIHKDGLVVCWRPRIWECERERAY